MSYIFPPPVVLNPVLNPLKRVQVQDLRFQHLVSVFEVPNPESSSGLEWEKCAYVQKEVKIKRLFFLLVICHLTFVIAVPAQITFERTYGGTSHEEGRSVCQTSDGGYISVGYTNSFGAGLDDVYLIKIDSLGDTLWTKTYGDSSWDYGSSIRQTSDGGYIIVGYTSSFGTGPVDIYLIKTNSSGESLWTKTYGNTGYDLGYAIQEVSDGGFIFTGFSESLVGDADVYLVRTNSLGDIIWTKTYGGTSSDIGYSIQQTSDGGFIISGLTYSFSPGGSLVYLIKTDSLGDTLWTRTYDDTLGNIGYSVQQTSDKDYIITGTVYDTFGLNNWDIFLIKTDSLGNILWSRTYGGNNWDESGSVQETSDGGYIIAGWTNSFGAGFVDVYLIKTNSSGDTLWTKTYGSSSGSDRGYSAQKTSDGGLIIVGDTDPLSRGLYDLYLIKTDSLGNVMVGVEEKENVNPETSSGVKLLQNQPNPFHHSTLIRYHLPEVGAYGNTPVQGSGISGDGKIPVRLAIYDLTGRLVETLVNQFQESGVYRVQWEGKNQPSGIYFYRLQSGNLTATKRLILLR